MAGPPVTPAAEADRAITTCFWFGLAFAIVGTIVIAAAWPGTEVGLVTGNVKETGSRAGVAIGGVLVGLGNTGILVAVVAWGVKLGTQSVRARD